MKVSLEAVAGSGVTGYVQLTALPRGGTRARVVTQGLEPGRTYGAFHYQSTDCKAPTDLLDTFEAGRDGSGQVSKTIEEDLEDLGSLAVRIGPGYGKLLACASLR